MSGFSRRGFIASAALLAVSTVALPLSDLHAGIPKLWGDGTHDDTLGIQALIDGKPVINVITGEIVQPSLRGGSYLISDTITLSAGSCAKLIDCSFVASPKFSARPMVVIHRDSNAVFSGNRLIRKGSYTAMPMSYSKPV